MHENSNVSASCRGSRGKGGVKGEGSANAWWCIAPLTDLVGVEDNQLTKHIYVYVSTATNRECYINTRAVPLVLDIASVRAHTKNYHWGWRVTTHSLSANRPKQAVLGRSL